MWKPKIVLFFGKNTIFARSRISVHFFNSIFQGILAGFASLFEFLSGMLLVSKKVRLCKYYFYYFLAVIYHLPRITKSSKKLPVFIFVKMGVKGRFIFQIYQTLCTVLSHTNLLTWYRNLVHIKRMRSMHSAQDCKK